MPAAPTYLRKLRLTELSLVDRGANEDATVCIAKRAADPSHEGSPTPLAKGSHAMKSNEQLAAEVATLTKSLETSTALVTTLQADLAKAKKKPSFPPDNDADDDMKKAYAAAVDAEVAKRLPEAIAKAGQEEVLKVGTATVRKSEVGEATFNILKAQQAQVDAAVEKADLAEVEKRVEAEFGKLPGEPVAKAKAVQALKSVPAEARTTIEAMLKAGNAALAGAMTEVGKGGGGGGAVDANGKLDELAKAHAKENKVSVAKAYDAVLATDEGRALYAQTLAK